MSPAKASSLGSTDAGTGAGTPYGRGSQLSIHGLFLAITCSTPAPSKFPLLLTEEGLRKYMQRDRQG